MPTVVETTGVAAAQASRIFIRVPLPERRGTTATLAADNSAIASSTGPVIRTLESFLTYRATADWFFPISFHSVPGQRRFSSGQMLRLNQRTALMFGWYSILPENAIPLRLVTAGCRRKGIVFG